MMYSAETKEAVSFWIWIELIVVVICWAVNLHFFIELTNHKLEFWQIGLIYLPGIINIFLDSAVAPMVLDFTRHGNQWKHIPGKNITYFFYIGYSILYALTGMVLVYRWGKKSPLAKVKLQAKTILIVTIPLWIIFGTLDYIFTLFDFYQFLPLGPLARIIYLFGIWYALIRYRFLVPKNSFFASEIINNIHEFVLVLNPLFKIITVNDAFHRIFPGLKRNQYRNLSDIVKLDEEEMDQLMKIKNGCVNKLSCRFTYTCGLEPVEADTDLSRIVDKFGDLTGIMIISKENRKLSHFIKRYNITGRQLEIIQLSLAGLNNTEISERLSISKKTTETHLFNIYNRLGINNRIELYNIAREFMIIA